MTLSRKDSNGMTSELEMQRSNNLVIVDVTAPLCCTWYGVYAGKGRGSLVLGAVSTGVAAGM